MKSPVALELNEQDGRIFLEIFVGRFPSLKLEITSESIEQNGVAELIGSKEVTKVVQVIDSKRLFLFHTFMVQEICCKKTLLLISACIHSCDHVQPSTIDRKTFLWCLRPAY